MPALVDPYWWTFAVTSVVQLALFTRWLYRRIRIDEVNRAFIQDMATNHLPQIYELLEKLCEHQKIAHSPQSPILWVDLTKHNR
jgi:hypothetical protein